MSVITNVREEGRVFEYVFSEPVTWIEIHDAQMRARDYYDHAPFKVHVLFDVRDLKTLPEGFLRVRSNAELSHPNCGHLVIIGSSTLIQVMGETIFRLARFRRAQFFKSHELSEAFAYLRNIIAQEVLGSVATSR